MRRERQTSFIWAVLCALGLLFGGVGCTSDDQQQEDQEQLEEDQQDEPAEYVPEDESGLDGATMEPAPMEMEAGGDPGSMMDSGMDSGMPPSVAEGLDQPVDDSEPDSMSDGGMDTAPAPMGQDSGAAKEFTYNVVRGDWLSKIAGRVYGDIYKWNVIHQANPSIRNPDLIYPNDKIVVPITGPKSEDFARSYGGLGMQTAPAEALQAQVGQPVQVKTVETGDSLSKIAKTVLGDAGAWKKIYEVNKDKIKDPNVIYVGQVLTMPQGAMTASTSPVSGPELPQNLEATL